MLVVRVVADCINVGGKVVAVRRQILNLHCLVLVVDALDIRDMYVVVAYHSVFDHATVFPLVQFCY